jgi:hypothetical protein
MSDITLDVKEIGKNILEFSRAKFTFVPAKLDGVFVDSQFEEGGVFFVDFLLSDLRDCCGLSEGDDDLILTVLDDLTRRGRIKIFKIQLTPAMRHTDCGFRAEIGRGIRSWEGRDVPKFVTTRFYGDEPMTAKEKKEPHTILNVKEQVENIRERRDADFRARFGGNSRETEILKELRRVDRLAAVELYKNLEALIGKK